VSNWSTHQFTRKGEQLRTKVEAGKCKLTLTKIKIGNGDVTLGEVKDMNDLKSPQLVLGISSCDVSAEDDRICEVVGIASSSNVESAFSVTEMGLYANDPDVGEILYLVGIDTAPDDMPNKNAQSPVTLTYQFELVTSNMANVVAMISPAGLVTVKMLNAHRTAAELDHPEKSVKRKHLADNVYTLPAPEATNAARFVGGDHKVRDATPGSIGAYSKGETNNLLAQKAPLASPALTGTPTVPTAGRGTNNGQIASTAFVAQAIAALVNSAPGALDTLQELAAALGNDANFAATVTNALAGKLGKTEKAASAGNSDTLGGQSLQWIINQINAAKTGIIAGNLAQNGWVKFANGLIVQWGVGLPVNKEEEYAVDFPIKFPSSCFGVWVTAIIEASKNRLSGVNGEFQVISANTAQCHLFFQQFNFPIQPAAPSIFAIGI
jgi:phage tail fibre protein